jgi:SAM-dependent methyltransferase
MARRLVRPIPRDASLVLYGGEPRFPGRGRPGSLWWPIAPAVVGRVEIHPSVRMFPGPWADALIGYARGLLVPGGTLEAPAAPPAAGDGGGSVLSWYLQRSPEILRTTAEAAGDAEALAALDELPERARPGDPVKLDGTSLQRLSGLIGQHGYLVGGLAYKAPILESLVLEVRVGDGRLDHLDIGGAYGLLGAELRANPALSIGETTTVDVSPVFERLAGLLSATHDMGAGGRPRFLLGAVQDLEDFPEADLVTAIGTLLYVPRESLQGVLDRLWGALRPGGVLIVHENIKAPHYTRDFDVMFEPDELDGYLRRYGNIRYFSSTAIRELAPERVRRATVFRAVARSG